MKVKATKSVGVPQLTLQRKLIPLSVRPGEFTIREGDVYEWRGTEEELKQYAGFLTKTKGKPVSGSEETEDPPKRKRKKVSSG